MKFNNGGDILSKLAMVILLVGFFLLLPPDKSRAEIDQIDHCLIESSGPTGQIDQVGDYFIWFFQPESEQIEVYWCCHDQLNTVQSQIVVQISQTDQTKLNLTPTGYLVLLCGSEEMKINLAQYQKPTIEIYFTRFGQKLQVSNGGLGNPVLQINIK